MKGSGSELDGPKAAVPTSAPLDASMLEPLRAWALGTEQDRAWELIDWKYSLADGLQAAAQEGKPLLLWAMNGAPLGAT